MKTMKTRNIVLIAIMAGALAIAAFMGDNGTEDSTTGTRNDEMRLELSAGIMAMVENSGGEVICARPLSFLFIDHETKYIVLVYISSTEQIATDQIPFPAHTSADMLKEHAQNFCDGGVLETIESNSDRNS